MARKYSVEELTQRIRERNVITRQSVLNESKMAYLATYIRVLTNAQ